MGNEERKNIIYETLKNKNQEKLKELNVSNEEVESILRSIDKRIEKLDSKILEYISNVEQEINYTFVDEYKDYLVNASTLKLEKNILGLSNGNEKLIRYLYSMDPNSKTCILKFQSFDSELEDKLVPFAELEFGDTLCFERETNKIVLYNHELDISTTIADNWNNFIKELYNDDVYKTKNGFEYKYKGMEVIITSEEINEELTNYADKIVDFYFESKDKINDFLFQKFERDEWYIKEYTKEQILEKIGKPTIYVDEVDYGSLCYLKSKLDEHLITIELYGLNLDSVSIDG